MGLRLEAEVSSAQWVTKSTTPLEQLLTFGPSGYEAYARLKFIRDPRCAGEAEADIALQDDHLPDIVGSQQC